MRAVVIDRFGGVEAFHLAELPVPVTGPTDVLIRVHAAGVGSWDAVERAGAYEGAFGVDSTFPYVLGWDGAGTIAAVGGDVSALAVGDLVYAASMPLPRGGSYAEYAVVDQEHVALVPGGMAIEQAAAMPWDALTALSGLDAAGSSEGRSLMVFGASGGIGHLAVQLAKRRGARVLAVASGDDGVALASRLGADTAVDGRREDVLAAASAFAPNGLDAALVTVGGTAVDRALAAVSDGGTVVWPNGVTPEPRPRPGAEAAPFDGARDRAATARLNALIETGPFQVHVDRVLPLQDAAEAHRLLEGHYLGKLVLRVS